MTRGHGGPRDEGNDRPRRARAGRRRLGGRRDGAPVLRPHAAAARDACRVRPRRDREGRPRGRRPPHGRGRRPRARASVEGGARRQTWDPSLRLEHGAAGRGGRRGCARPVGTAVRRPRGRRAGRDDRHLRHRLDGGLRARLRGRRRDDAPRAPRGRALPHHVEAEFKAIATCLRDAVRVHGEDVPSTKGTL